MLLVMLLIMLKLNCDVTNEFCNSDHRMLQKIINYSIIELSLMSHDCYVRESRNNTPKVGRNRTSQFNFGPAKQVYTTNKLREAGSILFVSLCKYNCVRKIMKASCRIQLISLENITLSNKLRVCLFCQS